MSLTAAPSSPAWSTPGLFGFVYPSEVSGMYEVSAAFGWCAVFFLPSFVLSLHLWNEFELGFLWASGGFSWESRPPCLYGFVAVVQSLNHALFFVSPWTQLARLLHLPPSPEIRSFCLFRFWWSSCSRNTGVDHPSLLQWITFCRNSSLGSIHLGWPCLTCGSELCWVCKYVWLM